MNRVILWIPCVISSLVMFAQPLWGQNVQHPKSETFVFVTISDPDGFTNLRSGPGTQFPVVGQVDDGETIETTPRKAAWWPVRLKNGETGYIHSSRIRLGPPKIGPKRMYRKWELLRMTNDEPSEAASQHGMNYRETVKKAMEGDAASLERVLKATPWMDGAAGESHCTIISGLLHILGDERFSGALRKLPQPLRNEVGATLEFELGESGRYLKTYFPKTAQLTHQ